MWTGRGRSRRFLRNDSYDLTSCIMTECRLTLLTLLTMVQLSLCIYATFSMLSINTI